MLEKRAMLARTFAAHARDHDDPAAETHRKAEVLRQLLA